MPIIQVQTICHYQCSYTSTRRNKKCQINFLSNVPKSFKGHHFFGMYLGFAHLPFFGNSNVSIWTSLEQWRSCTGGVEAKYKKTPFIRKLVFRISNYPGRSGPSGKHFLTVIVLHFLWPKYLPHLSDTYKELCINILFVRK